MPKVIVRNFQSIKEVKLNIEGFTLIVGESSQGKSATLRALQAAVMNRFRNGQVRNGEDHAEVLIKYSDDEPILHVIKSPTGSPKMKLGTKVFEKLSRTVPQEVSTLNNMDNLSAGESSYNLNFHPQFEKPLLLEFSQRKVMELLSTSEALDDLNMVKESMAIKRAENRGAFSSIDSILSNLKVQHSNIFSLKERLEPLVETISSGYAELQALESNLDMLAELNTLCDDLSLLINKENALSSIISHLSDSPESNQAALDNVELLLNDVNKFPEVDSKIEALNNIVCHLNLGVDIAVSQYNDVVSLLNILAVDLPIDIIQSRVDVLTDIVSCQSEIKELESDNLKLSNILGMLSTESMINNRIVELTDVVENNICPICHNKMNENHEH